MSIRSIHVNNRLYNLLITNTPNKPLDKITHIFIDVLDHGFTLILKEEKNATDGLIFKVENQAHKFSEYAINLWKVKNIPQNRPINVYIADTKFYELYEKTLCLAALKTGSAWVGLLSLMGTCVAILKQKLDYANCLSSSKGWRPALCFGLLSVISGIAFYKFQEMHANSRFELFNRLISIVSFTQEQKQETRVAIFPSDYPLVLQKTTK